MSELAEPVEGDGDHYSINRAISSMAFLRDMFPDGEADEMNFCLFSTSGIHGTYQTIEEEEADSGIGVTFLVVCPRIVRLTYGVVEPKTDEDFSFLKKLRRTSKLIVMNSIG